MCVCVCTPTAQRIGTIQLVRSEAYILVTLTTGVVGQVGSISKPSACDKSYTCPMDGDKELNIEHWIRAYHLDINTQMGAPSMDTD